MENAYRTIYLQNQQKQAKRYDLGRFDRKGKSAEKELEFFKGLTSQAANVAHQIEAGGYDTNSITKLEELLATFQGLYNNYAQEKIRNPAAGASESMRQIMDNLRDVLMRIQQAAPHYAERVKEHLKELDTMYVKTGGSVFIRGVPTPAYLRDREVQNKVGGSMGKYTGEVQDNVTMYEPTLAERIARDGNLPLYEDHKYHKLMMNGDRN
jgi:hypothetical protein